MRFATSFLSSLLIAVANPLLQPTASAEPLQSAATSAFTDICILASEKSKAPRDLALAAGYRADRRAPAGLEGILPLAALSASFSAPSDTGEVHVVSTVMPPPASPYSCAVTVNGDPTGLQADLETRLLQLGYRRNSKEPTEKVIFLDYQKDAGGGIDRVIGVFNRTPKQGEGAVLLIAYRVGP